MAGVSADRWVQNRFELGSKVLGAVERVTAFLLTCQRRWWSVTFRSGLPLGTRNPWGKGVIRPWPLRRL